MTVTLGLILLLFATFFAAVGQICFKKTALLETSFLRKFIHPTFLFGGVLFLCCPVISSLAAQAVDFSVLYAMTSLSFVFVLILSRWILKEKVDWPKAVGVVFIVIGLAVIVST